MNRRQFLSHTGVSGYTLFVFAGAPAAAAVQARRSFEKIAPPKVDSRLPGEPNMRLVDLETDFVVAGGGLAGVCAAIAAARHGARVVLVQDRSRLGGNSSSEVKMHVVGANSHRGRPGWRESGLIEELRLEDAVRNPQRSFELWDLLLYEKVMAEPNITLLLETTLFAAECPEGRIRQVTARCDRSEHLYRIRAPFYCDCTGDSRLALEAGAEMRVGREARSEFGESLAPEAADGQTLGSSVLFTSRRMAHPVAFTPPKWARKVTREQLRHRRITSWEYGYWWIEWGGDIDTVRDNERIRFELLSIALGVWDYIKNSGEFPDAANWAMDWVGMMPGRRGSRRVVGDCILTENDLMRGDMKDGVAIGGWPMDDHPPGGFDRPDLPPNTVLKTPEVFNIPLRSLYSRNVRNLFVAGRNISVSHAAFTSTRVMATCAAVGQAAGTAAALCLAGPTMPHAFAADPGSVRRLQQALLRDDQTIRGIRNEDPADLARRARIRASGEDPGASARNVTDGVTRDIPVSPACPQPETHAWAAPLESGEAWVELAWSAPQRVREVQVTFDSGFERELTLSASDAVSKGIIRAPQPETVRDYRIEARRSGSTEWTVVESVKGNYQRLRRHRFDPLDAEAVRVCVTATNGAPKARIFEIRCYA